MIHYHGCPLSGDSFTQLAYTGRHAMVSFAAKYHMELIAEVSQTFCLDNGAYSAWKAGKKFDIDGLAGWVNIWHRHPAFDFYVLPDVIDGDHHDNEKIRAQWFNLVGSDIWKKGYPVWHLHEPLEVLQQMVVGWRGIAIGSSGQYSTVGTPDWWTRMSEAMNILCDDQGRPLVKIHGLRMLDPTVFSNFPFASSDSTNVAKACGMDARWKGAYVPPDKRTRAIVMMQRIEAHASAATWSGSLGKNFELFG